MSAPIKDHTSTRLWRKLSAAAFATAAVVLLVATGASAAVPQPAQVPGDPVQLPVDFPEPGAQFRLPLHSEGLAMDFVDDPSPSSTAQQESWNHDWDGESAMEVGEYEQLAGPSIPIEMHEFRLESELGSIADDPNGAALSENSTPSYVIELDHQAGAAVSTLIPNQVGQVGWEQSMSLNLKVTIMNPPADLARSAGGEQSEPLVLTTKDPAVLVGSLNRFPPQGEIYEMQNPIDLVVPEEPDATVATIDKFPVKIGGI